MPPAPAVAATPMRESDAGAGASGGRDAAWMLAALVGVALLAAWLLRRNRGLADASARMAYAQHQLRERNADLQRQSETLRQQATQDALTGAMSRAAFLRALREVPAPGRLALAVFDLDHFKQINDGYGHVTGDAALRFVAGVVRECVDSHDLFGRFGGDEFLLAFPAPQVADPETVLDRIRALVASRAPAHVPPFPGLSLSIGVAHRVEGEDLDVLFHRADAALYRAKREGRNGVRVADAALDAAPDPARHL